MPISETYDFYVPEARRLADLIGIRADIHSVMELAKTFLSYVPSNPVIDLWQKKALCVAALTTYGRTFGSSVRGSLPLDLIHRLGDESSASHKQFKDLRDKWAAHSSNNLEESGVTLKAYKDELGKIVVQSIGERHKNTVVLSVSDMQQLMQLAEQLYACIQVEIQDEKSRLFGIIKSMDLSILGTDPAAFSIPDKRENHSKSRPRYGS